jgi:beta-lactamase superfamily II metal-dependent hydrolase
MDAIRNILNERVCNLLKVFNVGQGDAFLLQPKDRCFTFCEFSNIPLLIDTGTARAKVYQAFSEKRISVLITHSDNDHLGGLNNIIKNKEIECIYMPYYLPEIVKIRNYLQKHTSLKIKQLNWKELNKIPIKILSDNSRLCLHAEVLNPPSQPNKILNSGARKDDSLQESLQILSGFGVELPYQEILEYRTPLDVHRVEGGEAYGEVAQAFVHGFFIELGKRLTESDVTQENYSYYIDSQIRLTANAASVVFRFENNGDYWLFTGDASEQVFDRLIHEQKNIEAKFLKIPHHGSSYNLSLPKYAIVSHGGRKFGRATEAHPHRKIVELLDAQGVTTFYTNQVKKDGVVIKCAANGRVLSGLIEFV